MSIDTRTRSTSDGEHRRYGAYTAGANALRVDTYRDIDEDIDEAPRTGSPSRREGQQRGRTQPRGPRVAPPVDRNLRERRRPGRDAWVDDVTVTGQPAPALVPDAPALPLTLPKASFLLLMVGLVVVGVVGVLVLNTKINESSFRLDNLQSTQAALDLQQQQLEQQLAELQSPGNLRAAAARLGLVPAGTPAFINLPDGRVVGVPQPAGQ
jgi:hypothetical protein